MSQQIQELQEFIYKMHGVQSRHIDSVRVTQILDDDTLSRLRERYRWLCEAVAARSDLRVAHVLPQLHVIAWGTAKGV